MAAYTTGQVFQRRYRLLEEIGGGAYAMVFRAEQIGVGRDVAVKILARQPSGTTDNARERFNREVATLATLRHPNTLILHDCGQTEHQEPYFVTEYVPGRTLSRLLQDEGPLTIERAFRIIRQTLGSLREAHLNGLVHRDIKPSNIMVFDRSDEREVVKVLDFGIAKFMDAIAADVIEKSLTPRGELLGTPRYMAPELLGGGQVVPASDIFAVGLILYELITGKPAVQGNTPTEILAVQFTGRPPIDPRDPAVPGQLRSLLHRATVKAVQRRMASVDEFLDGLDELEPVLEGTTTTQHAAFPKPKPAVQVDVADAEPYQSAEPDQPAEPTDPAEPDPASSQSGLTAETFRRRTISRPRPPQPLESSTESPTSELETREPGRSAQDMPVPASVARARPLHRPAPLEPQPEPNAEDISEPHSGVHLPDPERSDIFQPPDRDTGNHDVPAELGNSHGDSTQNLDIDADDAPPPPSTRPTRSRAPFEDMTRALTPAELAAASSQPTVVQGEIPPLPPDPSFPALDDPPTENLANLPHVTALAQALMENPTHDLSEFDGVEDLARSLLDRITGDADTTMEISGATRQAQGDATVGFGPAGDDPIWLAGEDDEGPVDGTVELDLNDVSIIEQHAASGPDRTREVTLDEVLRFVARSKGEPSGGDGGEPTSRVFDTDDD